MTIWMSFIELKDDKLIHGLNLKVDPGLIPLPGDSVFLPQQFKVIERHFAIKGTSGDPEISVDVFIKSLDTIEKELEAKESCH